MTRTESKFRPERGGVGVVDRIAFFIKDGRAVDYYRNIFLLLPADTFVAVVDDLADARWSEAEAALAVEDVPSVRLTQLIASGVRYRVVVSPSSKGIESWRVKAAIPRRNRPRGEALGKRTGPGYMSLLALPAYAKALYAETLGRLFGVIQIERLVGDRIGHRLVAGPLRVRGPKIRRIGERRQYPDAFIGVTRVSFPHGVDLKSESTPNRRGRSRWDIQLCHGPYDQRFARQRSDTPTMIIGYPRYDHLVDRTATVGEPRSPLADSNRRLRMLWLPTKAKKAHRDNITDWLPLFGDLAERHHVTIRPHPWQLARDPGLVEALERHGLYVDTDVARDVGDAMCSADVVFCDYGGTIFSAIYLDRPLILLEGKGQGKGTEARVRKDIITIESSTTSPDGLAELLGDDEIWKVQIRLRRTWRHEMFGEHPHGGAVRTARLFEALLSGMDVRDSIDRAEAGSPTSS